MEEDIQKYSPICHVSWDTLYLNFKFNYHMSFQITGFVTLYYQYLETGRSEDTNIGLDPPTAYIYHLSFYLKLPFNLNQLLVCLNVTNKRKN